MEAGKIVYCDVRSLLSKLNIQYTENLSDWDKKDVVIFKNMRLFENVKNVKVIFVNTLNVEKIRSEIETKMLVNPFDLYINSVSGDRDNLQDAITDTYGNETPEEFNDVKWESEKDVERFVNLYNMVKGKVETEDACIEVVLTWLSYDIERLKSGDIFEDPYIPSIPLDVCDNHRPLLLTSPGRDKILGKIYNLGPLRKETTINDIINKRPFNGGKERILHNIDENGDKETFSHKKQVIPIVVRERNLDVLKPLEDKQDENSDVVLGPSIRQRLDRRDGYRFHGASTVRMFTAMCAAQLRREGQIDIMTCKYVILYLTYLAICFNAHSKVTKSGRVDDESLISNWLNKKAVFKHKVLSQYINEMAGEYVCSEDQVVFEYEDKTRIRSSMKRVVKATSLQKKSQNEANITLGRRKLDLKEEVTFLPFIESSNHSVKILNSGLSTMDVARCQSILSYMYYSYLYRDMPYLSTGFMEILFDHNKTPMANEKRMSKLYEKVLKHLLYKPHYKPDVQIDMRMNSNELVKFEGNIMGLYTLYLSGYNETESLASIAVITPTIAKFLELLLKESYTYWDRDMARVFAYLDLPGILEGHAKATVEWTMVRGYKTRSEWVNQGTKDSEDGYDLGSELDIHLPGIMSKLNEAQNGVVDYTKQLCEQMTTLSVTKSAGSDKIEFNVNHKDEVYNVKSKWKICTIPLLTHHHLSTVDSTAEGNILASLGARLTVDRMRRFICAMSVNSLFIEFPFKNALKDYYIDLNKSRGYSAVTNVSRTGNHLKDLDAVYMMISNKRMMLALDASTFDQAQLYPLRQLVCEQMLKLSTNKSFSTFVNGELTGSKYSYITRLVIEILSSRRTIFMVAVQPVLYIYLDMMYSGKINTTEFNNLISLCIADYLRRVFNVKMDNICNGDDAALGLENDGIVNYTISEGFKTFLQRMRVNFDLIEKSDMRFGDLIRNGRKVLSEVPFLYEFVNTYVGQGITEYLRDMCLWSYVMNRGIALDFEDKYENIDDFGTGIRDKYMKLCNRCGFEKSSGTFDYIAIIVGSRVKSNGKVFRPRLGQFFQSGKINRLSGYDFHMSNSRMWLEICDAYSCMPNGNGNPLLKKSRIRIKDEEWENSFKTMDVMMISNRDRIFEKVDVDPEANQALLLQQNRITISEEPYAYKFSYKSSIINSMSLALLSSPSSERLNKDRFDDFHKDYNDIMTQDNNNLESSWKVEEAGNFLKFTKTLGKNKFLTISFSDSNFIELLDDENYKYHGHFGDEILKRKFSPYIQIPDFAKHIGLCFGVTNGSDSITSKSSDVIRAFDPSHFRSDMTSTSVVTMLKKVSFEERTSMMEIIGFLPNEVTRAEGYLHLLDLIDDFDLVSSYASVSYFFLTSIVRHELILKHIVVEESVDQKFLQNMCETIMINLMYNDMLVTVRRCRNINTVLFRMPLISVTGR